MDHSFIQRATHITSFNLHAGDFQSVKYKQEIQHLFNMHFFPKFELSKTIDNLSKPDQLNHLVSQLKNENPAMFSKMHNYNLKGVGPGEVTLYFLINSAHLGGGSSAGVDLVTKNEKFEVKAVTVSQGFASNFKLGGTAPLSDISIMLNDIRTAHKLGGTKTEMSKSITAQMKQLAPKEFTAAEEKFASVASEYFKNHRVIFINNSPAHLGKIEAIKQVVLKDITIERVTSGTIKPLIKL